MAHPDHADHHPHHHGHDGGHGHARCHAPKDFGRTFAIGADPAVVAAAGAAINTAAARSERFRIGHPTPQIGTGAGGHACHLAPADVV